jgi:hypothetical protein
LIWELNVVAEFKAHGMDLPGPTSFRISVRTHVSWTATRKDRVGALNQCPSPPSG